MELTWPWVLLIGGTIVLTSVAVTLVGSRRRSRRTPTGFAIAHPERLTALPAYRRAQSTYRFAVATVATIAFVLVGAALGLAARPASLSVRYPDLANRDIVLCLDVSGSMVAYDSALVKVFGDLVKGFDGERISLVVFNASAVTYFPLTSDYSYIEKQLSVIDTQFGSGDGSYFDGTTIGDGSSLIGDGLASCTLRFDSLDQKRSRSIILATDNVLIGRPIFTLPQAGALARTGGIRVYGLNPSDGGKDDYLRALSNEYRSVVESTGGAYFAVDDPKAVPSIVDSIGAQQAVASRGFGQIVQADQPQTLSLLMLGGLIPLLLLAWRFRL